jgi:sporulation protein YlmC with PRC-barrel domain
MSTRTLIFALVTLWLETVPALAAPCKVEELPQKFAALPDFIVLEKGESWRAALTRALGCELPQPTLPSLASGQKIEPMVMVGRNVFTAKGARLGVVKDVVVNQDSLKVASIVVVGSTDVAIPISEMESSNGGFSLPDQWNTSSLDSKSISVAKVSIFDVFRPPVDQIKLRVDSEPSGATFFSTTKPTAQPRYRAGSTLRTRKVYD